MFQQRSSKQIFAIGLLFGAMLVASIWFFVSYHQKNQPIPAVSKPVITESITAKSQLTTSDTSAPVKTTQQLIKPEIEDVKKAEQTLEQEIISWLEPDKEAEEVIKRYKSLKLLKPNESYEWVDLSQITKIHLIDGEPAYLAEAYFRFKGRNFMNRYVLARPNQKKAIELKDYIGGGKETKIIGGWRDGDGTVVKINVGGSGQGVEAEDIDIVQFDGWDVKVLHHGGRYKNLGDCGSVTGRECIVNKVFWEELETTEQVIRLVETNVEAKGKDTEHLKWRTTSKIISLPLTPPSKATPNKH